MFGRLETAITIPAGGWPMSVNDGGGVDVATVLAGTYATAAAFMAAIEAAIELATGGAYTVSAALTEGATGFMTIARNGGGSFSITAWGSTDLRDAAGFTGTTGSAPSHTGTKGMQQVWLPDCPYSGELDPLSTGHRVWPGFRQTIGGEGDVLTLQEGDSYIQQPSIVWEMVGRDRALELPGATVNSWQQWVRQTQRGDLSYFTPGAPVSFYTDANTSTLLGAYRLTLPSTDELPEYEAGYVAYRRVEITSMTLDV